MDSLSLQTLDPPVDCIDLDIFGAQSFLEDWLLSVQVVDLVANNELLLLRAFVEFVEFLEREDVGLVVLAVHESEVDFHLSGTL